MINYQKLAKNASFREVFSYSKIPHLHNEIEIIYVKDGSSILTIDNDQYQLKPNSISIIFPNQIHKYSDNLNDISGYMLHVPASKFNESLPIISDLSQNNSEALDEIQKLCENNDLENAELLITDLLNEISSNPNTKENTSTVLTTTQMILKYCFENYKDALTLDQLSNELNINKFYISHIFNSKLEIGFADYLSQIRVEDAKKLLCTTDTQITNIAYDVGFSTIRSFNRRFREFCGMAPKDFKEKYKTK